MSAATDEAHLDMAQARERFESSTDFTLAIEEEFALVDPETLELVNRFEELYAACQRDEVLAEAAVGELISSEIEIRSGKSESFAEAVERQRERRARLFATARELGIALAATGTHPWASYLDQQIIDTPHYRRLREELRWVAQRNNTWSLHVHVGVRGADRAVAVCDHLRGVLPELLALSANSPFLDGRDTGLHTMRTEIFTRTFPRCGVHEPFGDWDAYADFVDLLVRTGRSSRRPSCGGACARITPSGPSSCGSATRRRAAASRSGSRADRRLHRPGGARLRRRPPRTPLRQREIEENLWRAIRHGMDGRMIDFGRREEISTREAVERLVEWTAPARESLGIDVSIPGGERRPARVPCTGERSVDPRDLQGFSR